MPGGDDLADPAPVRHPAAPDRVRSLCRLRQPRPGLHGDGVTALFQDGPSYDLKNSSEMILDVLQGGLGLPDRDYYLKDDEATKKIRDEYAKHVARMLELSGEHP